MSAVKGFKFKYLKALRGRGLDSSTHHVLVAVLNYANAQGENAHPGEKKLADDTGMSQRSVRRHLKWLTENGYLIKGKRGHGKGAGVEARATVYAVVLPDHWAESSEQPTGQNAQPTGQNVWTYRTKWVDLPDTTVPLSGPVSDPLSGPVQTGDPWANDASNELAS
jgi:biotin operon repressor